jgi:hypothetical protein
MSSVSHFEPPRQKPPTEAVLDLNRLPDPARQIR